MSNKIAKQMFTIYPSGEVEVMNLTRHPTGEELHEMVGGYIGLVPHLNKYRGWPCVAFCNTDGKRLNLRFNQYATMLWDKTIGGTGGDYLVGNIVIVIGPEEWLARM